MRWPWEKKTVQRPMRSPHDLIALVTDPLGATMGRFVQVTPQEFAWLLNNHRPVADPAASSPVRIPAQTGMLTRPHRQKIPALTPGIHRHWFEDIDGRVQTAIQLGMRPVLGSDGEPVVRYTGTHKFGPLYAHLLEIEEARWPEIAEHAASVPGRWRG